MKSCAGVCSIHQLVSRLRVFGLSPCYCLAQATTVCGVIVLRLNPEQEVFLPVFPCTKHSGEKPTAPRVTHLVCGRGVLQIIRMVPKDIRPEVELTRIDVMAWGVRRLAKYHLLSVDRPSVQFECGGLCVETPTLRNLKESPNFDNCILSFELFIPVKEIYAPPLNIRVFDHRKFGRKPLIGVHSIKTLNHYRPEAHNVMVAPPASVGEVLDASELTDGELDTCLLPVETTAIDIGMNHGGLVTDVLHMWCVVLPLCSFVNVPGIVFAREMNSVPMRSSSLRMIPRSLSSNCAIATAEHMRTGHEHGGQDMYTEDRTCTWRTGHAHGGQDMYMEDRTCTWRTGHVHGGQCNTERHVTSHHIREIRVGQHRASMTSKCRGTERKQRQTRAPHAQCLQRV